MRKSSAIVGLVGGLVYALIYAALAIMAGGAGHGTGIFLAAIWPYGLGLLVFPFVGCLAVNLRSFSSRVFFLSALAIHYALFAYFLRQFWPDELPYTERMWQHHPWSIVLPIGFYLLGQAIIWAAFIRGSLGKRNAPPNNRLQPTAR